MNLHTIRDALFHFPYTAALNAAKVWESRQIYSANDVMLHKQITTGAFARELAQEDSEQTVFYIQIKYLPPEAVDEFCDTPEYGVVWLRDAWRESHEFRLTKSAAAEARKALYEQRAYAEARLHRMATAIESYFTESKKRILPLLESIKSEESALQMIVQSFEKAAREATNNPNIKFYEPVQSQNPKAP